MTVQRLSLIGGLLLLAPSTTLWGQQIGTATAPAIRRDQQALTVLSQAVSASGGVSPLSAIQDFKGSGTITYYWGGQQVQGSATVRGKSTSQFRFDANLPNGVRTWAVSNGNGWITEPDGSTTTISFDNAASLGSFTFPLAYLVSLTTDSSTSISFVGLEPSEGGQVYHIRTNKILPNDPSGVLAHATMRDFYFDQGTFQLLRMRYLVHPKNFSTVDFTHEVRFSDYRAVNGIQVPFAINEFGDGQVLWSMQLTQVVFNSGLQDSVFQQ